MPKTATLVRRGGERGRSPLFARAQDLRAQFAAASERPRFPSIVIMASAEECAQRVFEKRLQNVAQMGPIVTPIVNDLQLREPTANLALREVTRVLKEITHFKDNTEGAGGAPAPEDPMAAFIRQLG